MCPKCKAEFKRLKSGGYCPECNTRLKKVKSEYITYREYLITKERNKEDKIKAAKVVAHLEEKISHWKNAEFRFVPASYKKELAICYQLRNKTLQYIKANNLNFDIDWYDFIIQLIDFVWQEPEFAAKLSSLTSYSGILFSKFAPDVIVKFRAQYLRNTQDIIVMERTNTNNVDLGDSLL